MAIIISFFYLIPLLVFSIFAAFDRPGPWNSFYWHWDGVMMMILIWAAGTPVKVGRKINNRIALIPVLIVAFLREIFTFIAAQWGLRINNDPMVALMFCIIFAAALAFVIVYIFQCYKSKRRNLYHDY